MSVDNINETTETTTEVTDILENEEEITATTEEKKKAINLLDLKYVKKFIVDKIKALHDIFYKKTDTVAKATGDEDGNNIKGTYLKKSELPDVPGASVAYAAEAGHASSADTATGDEDGNNIKSTYATKTETSGVSGITIDENGVMKRVLNPIDRSFSIEFGSVTLQPSGSAKGKIIIKLSGKTLADGDELMHTKDDGTTIFGTVDIQTDNGLSTTYLRYYSYEDFGIYANQTISVVFSDNKDGIPQKNEIIISQKQLIWEHEIESGEINSRTFTINDYLKNRISEQGQKNRKIELEVRTSQGFVYSTVLIPYETSSSDGGTQYHYISNEHTMCRINDALTEYQQNPTAFRFYTLYAYTDSDLTTLNIKCNKYTTTEISETSNNRFSIDCLKLYAIIE